MILRDVTEIEAPAGEVFRFFEQMEQNYLRWHPDHLAFRWIDGTGLRPGQSFAFDERIGSKLMRKTVVLTRVEPDRHVEFAPANRLIRFVLPRLLFVIEARGEARSTLIAEIHIRTGPIGAWLNRHEFEAVRRHMREEGENLKRLVEASSARHPATMPAVSDA